MKIKVFFDSYVLLGLLFVSLHYASQISIFSKLDEIIFIYMILAIMTRVLFFRRNLFFFFLIFIYIYYSVFLIFYNDLPLSHVMQIFITSKFLIVFLYFYTNNDEYKKKLLIRLIDLVIIIFFISLGMTLLQFIAPAYFCGFSADGRGFGGINAGGIFCGRIGYSAFLLTFMIILMSLKEPGSKLIAWTIKFRYWLLLVALVLLFLTFARKEMVLGFALLFYLLKDKIKNDGKLVFYAFFILLATVFAFGFYFLFQELNSATFTEKQVRYLIFLHAMDISQFYFPFGSGPGTYGSVMSVDYPDIYTKFGVAERIYLGTGDGGRGPIFDLFLVSLFAEYGIGWILFLLFLYKIGFSGYFTQADNIIKTQTAKNALILQVFVIAFFVPILLNWNGFLIFALLGLLSKKRSKYVIA